MSKVRSIFVLQMFFQFRVSSVFLGHTAAHSSIKTRVIGAEGGRLLREQHVSEDPLGKTDRQIPK
ncbi:hypothetical protein GCM10011391_27400 [Pullulanibacillus camelliae]|uniref:Uncharacterized protein n=1 Tax=Pullulanibacillus camelliae TaxID=1707096 RepID=A0A8J2YJ36_9BACL|nr:hypothetical protein GCM10011391_27400 [Pullulanibacillus camelliae]